MPIKQSLKFKRLSNELGILPSSFFWLKKFFETESARLAEGGKNKKTTSEGGDSYSLAENKETFADYDKTITIEDINILQSIGRKSINAFTLEDIEKAQKWAYKFYQQLGTKSPFFRRWFGDWRAYDIKTKRKYVSLNTSKINATDVSRKTAKNIDTNWSIEVSRNGIDETSNKRGKWSKEYHSLANVQEMLKNAVLLDTVVVTEPSKRLGNNTAFLHHMYCPIDVNGEKGIAKLYVTEEIGDTNKFYLVKIEMVPTDSTVLGVKASAPNSSVDTELSVADIFQFVKENNDKFEADSEYPISFEPQNVSKTLLNDDGTPKVFYHGTNAEFTEFDKKKSKHGFYGKGFYFTAEQSQANVYGNTMPVYLHIENPLMPGESEITKEQIVRFLEEVSENEDYSIENYGTYDVNEIANKITSRDAFDVIQDINATAIGDFGEAMQLFNEVNGTKFDGVMTPTETVVYNENQIKSAEDGGNIGTFSDWENDIRYSLPEDLAAYENGEITREEYLQRISKQKTKTPTEIPRRTHEQIAPQSNAPQKPKAFGVHCLAADACFYVFKRYLSPNRYRIPSGRRF